MCAFCQQRKTVVETQTTTLMQRGAISSALRAFLCLGAIQDSGNCPSQILQVTSAKLLKPRMKLGTPETLSLKGVPGGIHSPLGHFTPAQSCWCHVACNRCSFAS